MSNIIQLLPDCISNQIAAGEVVQRPSSVVKELLENSIDAGASEIKVIIKNSGKTLIQIIDNGKGMSEIDARMCFEKHATSKIRETKDLFNIKTMGFRGEALASIAAVSQVEMETCSNENELGTKIIIEGSEVKSQTPTSTSKGTTIAIKNLFYNIPARRNFLKSDAVETKHIIDEFQRISLSNPQVSFFLFNNDNEIYHLPISKLSHRIVNIFGKNYQKQLLSCQEQTDSLQIKGYLGTPENSKKTRGEQFFFVNNRFIKSPYLHHVIKTTFENLILPNYYPFYVIFIEIDPQKIDINVHPTKTEIKFEEEKFVYSILKSAVQKSISIYHISPSIDFEQNVNSSTYKLMERAAVSSIPKRVSLEDKNYSQFKNYDNQKANKEDWEKFFQQINSEPKLDEEKQTSIITIESNINDINYEKSLISKDKIQIHQRYIFTQLKSGVLIVDQKAAHERILYEKYTNAILTKSGSSQQLLFPCTFEINKSDFMIVKECEEEIRSLGFIFKYQHSKIIISGCPTEVSDKNLRDLFDGLIEQYKLNLNLSLEKKENLARSFSKKSTLPYGKILERHEMDSLIDQLFACENPKYTPEKKKTFIKVNIKQLEEMFINF